MSTVPAEAIDVRVGRLQAAMAEAGIDTLLVTELPSVRWLTGFSGSAGRALVRASGPAVLVTDDRYTLRAKVEAPAAEIVIDRTWGWLGDADIDGPLAVQAEVLPWAVVRELADLLEHVELVPTEGLLAGVRAVKDAHEIAALRRACAITVEAFEAALGWIAPGLTEREIARRLLDDMTRRGAEASAFDPIVAAGPNGAVPHHSPSDRPVGRGELLTMDFGARVDGYHADMTRTVAVGAVASDLGDLYDLVRRAQQAGVEAVRDGIGAKELDAVCREVITDAGHGADFRHGTGHGVGLMIHEEPFLGIQATGTLRDRMAITVEPGVYVPGLGGVRIEDVVLVGHTDGERLTTASHDLIVL
ncbi:M24 family metallopeptidase [Euzebya rosea]|uniref:M24 family metallopeptidase n=1 Tax=Euzebya rosea TaxID=2052804 RepID=UPI000D3E0E51|nr:Xaa-Pro peptidase family protein [Euzebya rosea]